VEKNVRGYVDEKLKLFLKSDGTGLNNNLSGGSFADGLEIKVGTEVKGGGFFLRKGIVYKSFHKERGGAGSVEKG